LLDFGAQRVDTGGAGARLREVALQLFDELRDRIEINGA
jgi:hypothetical protein